MLKKFLLAIILGSSLAVSSYSSNLIPAQDINPSDIQVIERLIDPNEIASPDPGRDVIQYSVRSCELLDIDFLISQLQKLNLQLGEFLRSREHGVDAKLSLDMVRTIWLSLTISSPESWVRSLGNMFDLMQRADLYCRDVKSSMGSESEEYREIEQQFRIGSERFSNVYAGGFVTEFQTRLNNARRELEQRFYSVYPTFSDKDSLEENIRKINGAPLTDECKSEFIALLSGIMQVVTDSNAEDCQ